MGGAYGPVNAIPGGDGTWAGGLGVPADPSLFGLQAALQALFPTLGPLGLDVSNGVIATIGY